MSDLTEITLADHGAVAVVTIDRPEKLNALGVDFWPQLREVLARLEADGTTRAVVLTGAGEKAFSAGGDIAGFGDLDGIAARRAFQAECLRTFAAVEECALPVIAAVNGYAFGGGCELALACDLVLASDRATFAMPESGIGLVPGFGVLRAPAVIGRHWTKWMVLAGERIDAEQAERIGLVQRRVPHDELLDAALALGERVAAAAPLAVEVGKRMINRGIDTGETSWSLDAITLLQSSEDTAEGIAAFAQKRPPRFEGR
ncbi:enoyl-CoA hydratase/isomerase family protein [Actinomycetospora termitidis]|uniref:Enoyl-CoA hydratase/isomerase family protein n=1 Tax=Actinomycetospora termitidis TaxID=3053470 RepID=A0ABT7M9Q5_9PSEU|nr:enoyl-CoA hydratase/isomerase family protein [Actinomycetospora sp. Odt1-22]MDL5157401.1 enoyl-CoA hydratase/isomerase family protein [Actinomycetospora sp. Odt1-22]